MAFNDGLKDKILKLGAKQKLGAILKYANNSSEDVRMAVAMALGMIPTYDSGMALIPLLRDQSAMVRASACEAAAQIHAKNCEEYVKKLAFTETDPNVKQVAKTCFEGAISRGMNRYEIDSDLCDSCGACEYICPAGAIEPD